ncbi:MAG: MGMT family protein [Candidatus Niyogibacteria bacterium]|nr:MGMT family protein [Candidatus Niyogibacteria bacterium]
MYTAFERKIWAAAKRIPCGRVATYADIARIIGSPQAGRAVGNALNKNPYQSVPCHRVVRSDGAVGGYAHGARAKIRKLAAEGVLITAGTVNFKFYRARI